MIKTKGLCRRCGGSGQLLRPTPRRLTTFRRCTDCGGRGVRWCRMPVDPPAADA